MLLRDRLEKAGTFCFRYRSYQFLLVVAVIFAEQWRFRQMQENLFIEGACVLVALTGLAVRALTVGFVHNKTSGRNTTAQKAVELNTTGAYSVVRNPLYIGNFLIFTAICMMSQSFAVVVINALIFAAIYIPIIMTEEAFLLGSFGAAYEDYARRVNCFIPNFRGFTHPARRFSAQMALSREHDTWLTAAVGLTGVKLWRSYLACESVGTAWYAAFGTVVLIWAVLKAMKKAGRLNAPADLL